ncbi:DUF6278 family protein [Streptomyces sp. NPDC047000]|uniref:DUF6278 family protein n=1 Tax=Streptomyces sp. NPDC047000 TaxID=3155474 RepID=UPI0033C4614A
MNIPFLGNRRKNSGAPVPSADPEGLAALLSECELLRDQASREGVALDDSAASLEALDQLLPRWREDQDTRGDHGARGGHGNPGDGDEESLTWLGNDAGLYLGTVLVRTVPGARWELRSGGLPVVRLLSGREFDVVESGHAWAANGAPELSQVYAEVAED